MPTLQRTRLKLTPVKYRVDHDALIKATRSHHEMLRGRINRLFELAKRFHNSDDVDAMKGWAEEIVTICNWEPDEQ